MQVNACTVDYTNVLLLHASIMLTWYLCWIFFIFSHAYRPCSNSTFLHALPSFWPAHACSFSVAGACMYWYFGYSMCADNVELLYKYCTEATVSFCAIFACCKCEVCTVAFLHISVIRAICLLARRSPVASHRWKLSSLT